MKCNPYYSELEYYVSCLCSNPMPDRYTEMKTLKKLIDEGKVSLLQAVVEKVALNSCIDKRTPVFKKLLEKFEAGRAVQPVAKKLEHIESNKSMQGSSRPNIVQQLNADEVKGTSMSNGNIFVMSDNRTSVEDNQESILGPQSVLSPLTNIYAASSFTSNNLICSDMSKDDVSENVDIDPLKLSSSMRFKVTANPSDLSDPPDTILSSGSGQMSNRIATTKDQANPNQKFRVNKTHSRKLVEKWIVNKNSLNPNENIYKCEHCAKRFDKSESLDIHKRRVHRIVKASLKIFEKHRHQKGTKFACEECGRKYNNKGSLNIHKSRSHNKRSTIPCPENCGKMLTKTSGIKKHLLSHRPQSEWPIGCPLCGKRFQGRTDLSAHILSKRHSEDNLPEVGSDQWWALVYWDRPQEAPRKQ